MQPYSEVIYYWSKETPENCNGVYGERPCFSPKLCMVSKLNFHSFFTIKILYLTFFLTKKIFFHIIHSWFGVLGNIFFVIGTALYNRYFSSWPYRKIFAMTQLALVFVNLMYVLKNEFNCFFLLV